MPSIRSSAKSIRALLKDQLTSAALVTNQLAMSVQGQNTATRNISSRYSVVAECVNCQKRVLSTGIGVECEECKQKKVLKIKFNG